MELHEALCQIDEIRTRIAATEQFRGYRAIPIALSGGIAIVAALIQPLVVVQPMDQRSAYLIYWIAVAIVAGLVSMSGLAQCRERSTHPLSRELTILALSQFAPCLIAGGLVTLVVYRNAPELSGGLPGLWQILFSLGIFASCRLLPRAILWVGLFYLLCGSVSLSFATGSVAGNPWLMGVPFGLGQFGVAAILYWHLEANHDH